MKLVLSWLLVAIPLGWGVWKMVEQSSKLFTGSPPPATAAPK